MHVKAQTIARPAYSGGANAGTEVGARAAKLRQLKKKLNEQGRANHPEARAIATIPLRPFCISRWQRERKLTRARAWRDDNHANGAFQKAGRKA